MRARVAFLTVFIVLFCFTVFAEEFFSIVDSGTGKIEIILNATDPTIQTIELYRSLEKSEPVNIYEFSSLEKEFSEFNAKNACYHLKIYYDNGSVRETEAKCYSRIEALKKINISTISVFLLFILSLIVANCVKSPFFDSVSSDKESLLKFVTIMLGERTEKVSFLNSIDSIGHPLLGSLSLFTATLESSTEAKSQIEYRFNFHRNNSLGAGTFVDLGGFLNVAKSKELSKQLIFNISDGTALSDWSIYFSDESKREINFPLNIQGLSSGTLLSKKNLVSVEPFLLSSQLKSIKGMKSLKPSGVYLFFIVVAVVIVIGSLLSTITQFSPALKDFLNVLGGL
ncbi:MAG: hypothetical protein ACOX2F_07485 [bacterium]